MNEAGWYPDPDGTPDRLRWWDGQAWTDRTQTVQPPRLPRGLVPLSLLVVVIVGLVVALVLRPDHQTAPPLQPLPVSGTPWDERPGSPSPSVTASDSPSMVREDCPTIEPARVAHPADGKLHGGGLVVTLPTGFTADSVRYVPWGQDEATATRPVKGADWVSVVSVFSVRAADGFGPPRWTVPLGLLECHTSSARFPGLTKVVQVSNESVTVAGKPAQLFKAEAHSTQAPGGGAFEEYLVIDLGVPGQYSVFWAGTTFSERTDVTPLLDQARASITVGA